MTSVRIVLDTTNLISALIQGQGPSGQIVDAWRRRRVTLISSEQQIDEIRDVLSRPRIQKFVDLVAAANLLEALPELAELVEPTPDIKLSSDPKDNYIIGMAIAGKVDAIVTGDKHDLLSLGEAQSIPILTAREILSTLNQ